MQEVKVLDLGDFKDVPVLELLVSEGETIEQEQSLIVLESDKAAMEIPASHAGIIKELKIKVGDKVSAGDVILLLEETGQVIEKPVKTVKAIVEEPVAPVPKNNIVHPPSPTQSVMAELRRPKNLPLPPIEVSQNTSVHKAHAGPAVRLLARELGVDLSKVTGSGRKNRILKEDVHAFVKQTMQEGMQPVGIASGGGMGIPEIPAIDFSQFGEIETQALKRIKKLSGAHLHRSWLNIPHITQFDEADITDLEIFRKELTKKRNVKITLFSFLLKACAAALKKFPEFNASLDSSKENLILKKYYHIGVAVDTPNGLVVPVIKNVDNKGLFELAENLLEVSQKARAGKLLTTDMQGGCFTITSLGGIGGTAFTPIINAPEVAILGLSRAKMQPIYQGNEFVPRLMLPLSLSYDHRVIDGAAGVRFTQYLSFILSDVRRLLL